MANRWRKHRVVVELSTTTGLTQSGMVWRINDWLRSVQNSNASHRIDYAGLKVKNFDRVFRAETIKRTKEAKLRKRK